MALTKGYKAGEHLDDIKAADETRFTLTGAERKSNAGRKRANPETKKQRFTFALTNEEHEKLLSLAEDLTRGSASAVIAWLINSTYDKMQRVKRENQAENAPHEE